MACWSKLANDLKADILCRLPEKDLIRLKCVSKSCYSLISNVCVPRISPPSPSAPFSGFLYECGARDGHVMKYMACTNDGGGGRSDGGVFMESFHALAPFGHIMLDCCNGLLLFVKCRPVVPAEYYVCNPATKQCISIPVNHAHREISFAGLDFDPRNSLTYKIVRVDQSTSSATVSYPPKLDIFSSDTGKWVSHLVPLDPKLYGYHLRERAYCLNGVFYVLSNSGYLVFFNLKAENVNGGTIELPDMGGARKTGVIGVSKGCVYYSNQDGSTMQIWLLEGGKWILEHSISISNVTKGGRILEEFWITGCFKPYAFHPNSEVIFFGSPIMIFSYHLQTQQVEVLCDIRGEDRSSIAVAQQFFPYSRCLVALNKFCPETSDQSNLSVGHLGTVAGKCLKATAPTDLVMERIRDLSDMVERISIAQTEAAKRDETIISMLSAAAAGPSQILMDKMTQLEILVRSTIERHAPSRAGDRQD